MKPNQNAQDDMDMNENTSTDVIATPKQTNNILSDIKLKMALQRNGHPVREYYGETLLCDGVVFDTERRKITTEDGNEALAMKSSFHTVEYGWLDSYTDACQSFAQTLHDSIGENMFPDGLQIPIMFEPMITKRNRASGRPSDNVRLAD